MNLTILLLLGRSWKASELRLKSWDDLQKLWYILLKEKNMLMTQRQMLQAKNLCFPNPERIPKVPIRLLFKTYVVCFLINFLVIVLVFILLSISKKYKRSVISSN